MLDDGGLVLLVKPSGVKTWLLRYYKPANNKRTIVTIGNYPAYSLLDARAAKDEERAMPAKGINPQDTALSRKRPNSYGQGIPLKRWGPMGTN